jgi:hypothetical protein
MAFLKRVNDRINGWIGKGSQTFHEAATVEDDDPRASEYRRLSASKRDLNPLQFDKAQRMSFYLWQRNAIARRLIDILVNFCSGDELKVEVKIKKEVPEGQDEDTGRTDAQKIWEDCAMDPENNLDSDLSIFAQDLFINGELVVPTFVRMRQNPDQSLDGDGRVRFGYIDPANIKRSIPDPMNVRSIRQLIVVPAGDTQEIPLDVIHVDDDPASLTYEKRIGQVFYWRINHVANQTRGHGELLELADWLDGLDQLVFDALDGIRLRNNFFYTKKLIGASPDEVEKDAKTVTTPRAATVRVHNDKVEYDVVTPDLKAADIERAIAAFQTFVVGAKGYPIMWFGSGADANKATAGEMAIPTMRMLKAAQKVMRRILKDMVLYVCDQAQLAGTLKLADDEYVSVQVSLYDFERKDAAVISTGLTQTVTALVAAADKGWVSDETAKKVVDSQLERLGVEVDPDETVETIKSEKNESGAEDPYAEAPPANTMIGKQFPPVVSPAPISGKPGAEE